jgi:hypothetical protein
MAVNWWNSRRNRQLQNALVLNGGFRLDVVSTRDLCATQSTAYSLWKRHGQMVTASWIDGMPERTAV